MANFGSIAAVVAGSLIAGMATAKEKAPPAKPSVDVKGECHGVNSCKGKGECGGPGTSCAGTNSCKGKGWITLTEKECRSKKGTFKAEKTEHK